MASFVNTVVVSSSYLGATCSVRRRISLRTIAELMTPVCKVKSQATSSVSKPISPSSRAINNKSTKARSPLSCLRMRSRTTLIGIGKSHVTNGAPWRNAPAPVDNAKDHRLNDPVQTDGHARQSVDHRRSSAPCWS